MKNWLSAYSLVGKELWIVRNAEGRPDGSGFIVFDHHDDAVKALTLNGKLLGQRTIQVTPSIQSSLDLVSEVKAPFPVYPLLLF